jgi:RsiW-degrading membrane proteinase PrsW (M82 family)
MIVRTKSRAMRPMVYIALALAPAIAASLYLYFGRQSDEGYRRSLLYAFAAGIAGILFLLAAQLISSKLGLSDLRSLRRILFFSFITIGGSSELGKFVFYRFLIVPRKAVDTPLQAIVFSVMTALGFTTAALLMFIMNPVGPPSSHTLFALSVVFANIMFGVIMGFFVGMSKFLRTRIVFSLTGLLGAAFFHGIYNFCLLTSDYKLLSLFAFGSTIIVLVLGLKAANTTPEPSDQRI